MKRRLGLPQLGERVVVHGVSQLVTVCDITWDNEAHDWKLSLDWGVLRKVPGVGPGRELRVVPVDG